MPESLSNSQCEGALRRFWCFLLIKNSRQQIRNHQCCQQAQPPAKRMNYWNLGRQLLGTVRGRMSCSNRASSELFAVIPRVKLTFREPFLSTGC